MAAEMPMTPDQIYSLLDSGIKIGLGAIIGAVAAHFAARGNFERELQKEHLRRRQDSLDQIFGELGVIENCMVDLYAAYVSHVKSFEAIKTVSPAHSAAMLQAMLPIRDCLRKIYAMEARLKLLGLRDCAGFLADYRLAVTDFQGSLSISNPTHPPKQLEELLTPLVQTFERVCEAASAAYKQP